MKNKAIILTLILTVLIILSWGVGDAWKILVFSKNSHPFKSPFLKAYLNTYQGALEVMSGNYQLAEEFFSGDHYNKTLLPFVSSLNSIDFNTTLKDLSFLSPKKGGDNVRSSLKNKIKILEKHLKVVDDALANLSGYIDNVFEDQQYVQAYNTLLRWKVYLSALTCSLYFEDYYQKIYLLLDVTKKDKEALDKMIYNLGNLNVSNPLDKKCVDQFKNSLIKTRESLFLLEQVLEGFLNKVRKQTSLLFEDPLECLSYQLYIGEDMDTTLKDLSSQILKISQGILESSKKLDQLLKLGQLNCKSLSNLSEGDQGRGKELSKTLNKLNNILESYNDNSNGRGRKKQQKQNSQKSDKNLKKLYDEIKSDEDLRKVEKESIQQIKETLNHRKYYPFYESVKNYFEEFYGKWWAKDKKTEGEILNEGW